MVSFLLSALLFFSVDSIGAESLESFFNSSTAQKACDLNSKLVNGIRKTKLDFVKYINNDVFFIYNLKNSSRVFQYSLDGNLVSDYQFEGFVTNISRNNDKLLFITKKEIFVVNSSNMRFEKRIRTLPVNYSFEKSGYARGLYVHGQFYYIAHGVKGVAVYDYIHDKHVGFLDIDIKQPHDFHKSMATDITGLDNTIYISYDDVTLSRKSKAFEGILKFDLIKSKLDKTYYVNQKQEAYYMTNLHLEDSHLYVSNLHLNFVHSLKKINRSRFLRPQKRVWKYEPGKLIGRGIINNQKIYGCFINSNLTKIISGSSKL